MSYFSSYCCLECFGNDLGTCNALNCYGVVVEERGCHGIAFEERERERER
jgi:hypothetical protein